MKDLQTKEISQLKEEDIKSQENLKSLQKIKSSRKEFLFWLKSLNKERTSESSF